MKVEFKNSYDLYYDIFIGKTIPSSSLEFHIYEHNKQKSSILPRYELIILDGQFKVGTIKDNNRDKLTKVAEMFADTWEKYGDTL